MNLHAGLTADPPHPHEPGFWRQSAERLKHVADLSRRSYEALDGDVAGHDPANAALGAKLADSYAYLTALALEYLAIGLLMTRNPRHFLGKPPQHRILDLLDECGIDPDDRQRQVLRRIQPALQWSDHAKLGVPEKTAAELGSWAHAPGGLTPSEVRTLEPLYDRLQEEFVSDS